ncbi:YbfB/YjiJ family MFS transporter [Variovorax sp. PBL-E5]|uniref:YbfB/YjiJ family MFS transporter n=1 Tax=Variovorax sp. PBL-E5 TaxID=434014 RepID=UPI001319B4D2|nr:YbfB/YjiJ family MFS transporter [Variovorax sp. PBL-E5]VTU25962.1 Major Facilitator Superfamily protein [Variovorax sp. PBL-E5]
MSNASNPSIPVATPSFLAVGTAGLLALALAMGIGRFAFTPMLALMLRAGSTDVAAGGWLAAANYAGYLVGALTTARLPLSPQRIGLAALAVIVLSTAAMGWTASLPIWLVLRFAAGVASAWVLISTSVWCLAWLARLGRPSGAGILYAGVGAGIAVAGLYCWRAGAAEVAPDRLWLQLGALSLVGFAVVAALMPRDAAGGAAPAATPTATATAAPAPSAGLPRGLVISYGMLGFGYILPATFLPVLARAVVDDPAVFGAAWPVFGAAAAVSTLLAGALFSQLSRRDLLAGSHVLMALGCLLPVLHLSAFTVLAAALLVGGTFVVATMAGMQEARAGAAGDPTRALGRMTAAFAIGQMIGPMLSSVLSTRTHGFGGLFIALAAGAVALLGSAVWLAFGTNRVPSRERT